MADTKPIGLKEFITKVKEELLEEHDESRPLFVVGPVELQISFTVERDAKGGISFHVVQGGVEKKWTEVQTVKLTLNPILSAEEVRQNLTPEQKEAARKALKREAPDID